MWHVTEPNPPKKSRHGEARQPVEQVKVPHHQTMTAKKKYVFRLKPDHPNQAITTDGGEKLFVSFKSAESMREKVRLMHQPLNSTPMNTDLDHDCRKISCLLGKQEVS